MNLYIGKLQNDGVVRYIAVPYEEQYNDVPRILGTFYSTDARVEALINLGNLVTLQPSPYKKWKGQSDTVNCRAEIRDDGEKKESICRNLPTPSKTMPISMPGFFFIWKVVGTSKPQTVSSIFQPYKLPFPVGKIPSKVSICTNSRKTVH